jgi:predicted aspartyl protease
MGSRGGQKMGRFYVEFDVANFEDIVKERAGIIPSSQVRRTRIRGMVDPGATQLVLPKAVVTDLGLPVTGKVKVRYADRRSTKRDAVEGVLVEVLGRHAVFNAIVEPKRDSALIGAIVLEALDFLVDCGKQRLVPRDPHFVVSEIE